MSNQSLREAAQQALEQLEVAKSFLGDHGDSKRWNYYEAACVALRAALAQPDEAAPQPPAEQGAELPNVVTTAPERIYLVIGEDCPPDADFNDIEKGMGADGVTWCADKIDDNSIEYMRADRAARGGAA